MRSCIYRVASVFVMAIAMPLMAFASSMSTSGQFTVGESGAASYLLPMQLPPGAAGLAPQLALTYNSQGGNGLVGVGWALSGLSSITRCPQTFAQDGILNGVNFDMNDRFCLDGQRLIVTNGGVYGANGTEYHTERDTFSKITSYITSGANGPTWFKVQDKAGRISEYGHTLTSNILAQGTSVTRVWAINKLQDAKGNYLTVDYVVDAAASNFYPQRIAYAGNANVGVAPNNSVQFVYDMQRQDITTAYQAGVLVRNNARLSKIQTFAGSTQVKEYRFSFDTELSTQRSRLYSIKECDSSSDSAKCLPPSTVTYTSNNAPTFSANTIMSGVMDWGYETARAWVDFNGDGKADFCRTVGNTGAIRLACTMSAGTGFGATIMSGVIDPGYEGYQSWVDVNGDGLADYCTVVGDQYSQQFICTLSTGTGFGSTIASQPGLDRGYADGAAWVDFNGDGRADYCRIIGDSRYGWLACNLSTGNGFDFTTIRSASVVDNGYGGTRNWVDVNGDGRADFCRVIGNAGAYQLACTLSTGNGFGETIISAVLTGNGVGATIISEVLGLVNIETARWVDVNGDGKADYCRIIGNPGSYQLACAISTGKGFVDTLMTPGAIDPGYVPGRAFVDINGDGKADFCRVVGNPGSYQLTCLLSNGNQFGAPIVSGVIDRGYDIGRAWVDFTGDGKADYCRLVGVTNNSSSYLACTPLLVENNGLATLTDGLGVQVAVQYKPLTDSGVYTKDAGSNYPIIDLQIPMYVVSSMSSSSGNGGTLTTNYSYGGLKADLSGRGVAGFRWMQASQVETGIVNRTEFRQDWPFTGQSSVLKKMLAGSGNGGLLNQIANTYGCIEYLSGANCVVGLGKVYSTYLSSSTQANWDLNGAALPAVTTTNQFDKWGNPLTSAVTTEGGFSRTTVNTYTNDETKWFLGRLTNSTVTNVTPQGELSAPIIGAALPPTVSISRNPSPMVAGQIYTVSWTTTNATSLSYSCSASGTGINGTGSLATMNGSAMDTANIAWVGYPSTCVWTATGVGGSKTFNETLTTVAPPVHSVAISPTTINAVFKGSNRNFSGTASRSATASVSGGAPPFSYAWHQIDGDIGFTIANEQTATATFSKYLNPEDSVSANFLLTVTDALGRAVTATIPVSFTSGCIGSKCALLM